MLACNAIGLIIISSPYRPTWFNVVLSTVRALSWVAETLHRLHDFWSRSAIHACAETLSGSLNLSSYFI